MRLFHVSDDPAIDRFVPRASPHVEMPVVWAVDDSHLAHYLLPRDCPRVCFRRAEQSRDSDVQAFLGRDACVVAIENSWLARVQAASLHVYLIAPDGFYCLDPTAGYWVSPHPVHPTGMTTQSDLPEALARHGAALRVLPSLWDLHDAVAGSSLAFSMIRMRNAEARPMV